MTLAAARSLPSGTSAGFLWGVTALLGAWAETGGLRSGCQRLAVLGAAWAVLAAAAPAEAQLPGPPGVYAPLDQTVPPGTASYWAAVVGRAAPGAFQPVQIVLPGEATVSIYSGWREPPMSMPAPAKVGVHVGHTYRLKISEMPELPGVELYPTIEILDRLHPPKGQLNRFPVPVEITQEEIETALVGRMVTKVIYLEQPDRARVNPLERPGEVREIPFNQNLLVEADRAGRPMVIVRLGGRVPDRHVLEKEFYGPGGPLSVLER